MTQVKLTQAGHTLCLDLVGIPQFGQVGTANQWVWWVRDPTGTMVGEKHTLCFDPLDDSDLRKAYSEAAYRLGGKVQGIIGFDDLDWSP